MRCLIEMTITWCEGNASWTRGIVLFVLSIWL